MKKYLMKGINANVYSRFFKTTVIVLMLSGALSSKAQAAPEFAATRKIGDPVITHVEAVPKRCSFNVRVDNASGEKFTILIKDDLGSTIYRGSFVEKDFNKKFLLPKPERNKLVFIVKSESGSKTESFEINSSTRVIEEVVVRKL